MDERGCYGNDSANGIIRQFDDREICALWILDEEGWHFSVVDIVGVLSEGANLKNY